MSYNTPKTTQPSVTDSSNLFHGYLYHETEEIIKWKIIAGKALGERFDLQSRYDDLKEELEYWKKYSHLDFEKLRGADQNCADDTDPDYWDCVVIEHGLLKYDKEGNDLPDEEQDKPEYIKFCKYFPRPIPYEDSSDEEEEDEAVALARQEKMKRILAGIKNSFLK